MKLEKPRLKGTERALVEQADSRTHQVGKEKRKTSTF